MPDSSFELNKLNQFNGNYIDAEMVKAFITSTEYRQRLGLRNRPGELAKLQEIT